MTRSKSAKIWKCRGRAIELGHTLIMGVLNVTPDSFSDGGSFVDPSVAVERALEMVAEGAGIIDVGGESSRPGSKPVSAEEQIRRTAPVIAELARQSDCLISIDTMSSAVARAALEAGAHIINDISGFERDPNMAALAAEYQAGAVLMHMQGLPENMQDNPQYESVGAEVCGYLRQRAQVAIDAGLDAACVAVDPGIGFGKTQEHNVELLQSISEMRELGCPVLIGASRKSLVGYLTGRPVDDRLAGSLGVAAYAIGQGAEILRVHDVKETCDLARVLDKLTQDECPSK
ncbi:dihydropteroate synthase [Verrucomicrobiota bacterium]